MFHRSLPDHGNRSIRKVEFLILKLQVKIFLTDLFTNLQRSPAVYEELGKYGDLENQVLCRERIEELEPSIRYCLHKAGESNIQTPDLLDIGKMEGPMLGLFRAKLEESNKLLVAFWVCRLLWTKQDPNRQHLSQNFIGLVIGSQLQMQRLGSPF